MEKLKLDYYYKDIEDFRFKEVFDGCTYPWETLNNVNEYIKKFMNNEDMKVNKAEEVGEFFSISGNYFIDEGTKIHANVVIQGPVLIGKNVEIQSGALIRPGSIIGDGCVVGHGSEIKHAIMQNKSKVASLAFVGDSILGYKAHMGAGSITSNLKSTKTNVVIDGIETNLRKVGAFLGDYAEIGCNAVLNPGTIIGRNTIVYPLTMVRGVIPSNKIVKSMDNIVERR